MLGKHGARHVPRVHIARMRDDAAHSATGVLSESSEIGSCNFLAQRFLIAEDRIVRRRRDDEQVAVMAFSLLSSTRPIRAARAEFRKARNSAALSFQSQSFSARRRLHFGLGEAARR